ncbi:MAG: glucose-6-phosphate dehydrogenase [Chloroflexota bacterium]
MNATLQVTAEALERPPLPKADPCIIVIFGASGDLTRRLLMPALYDLACFDCLDGRFEVLGTGRTPLSDEAFRARVREALASKDGRATNDPRWLDFEQRLHYLVGDPNDPAFYPRLAADLEARRQEGASQNRLFYVATPASLAEPIVQGLGAAGLARSENGWSRIVLEKPFGRDLQSARDLNRVVLGVFSEEAVFRIDHFLGKETVQNLAVFRFGNSMFEPVWNRNYVEYVEITAAETLGVEGRAAFYEETGALRDMVANHLLQLLTITAMEPPVAFDADAVREEKVKVLRSIRPMSVEEVAARAVRGQYRPGMIGGTPVPGYRDEPGVGESSTAETFAAVEFYVDNWRWHGVPFYVRTGKRLARSVTEVVLHFKATPHTLFTHVPERHTAPNQITLRIQPDEGIGISFAAKRPGSEMRSVSVKADFAYASVFGSEIPTAYETLLLDAMLGDATLFARDDELEAAWRIITPIEEAWAQLPLPAFPNYAAGTDGPPEADSLTARNGHAWCPIRPARD